MRDVLPSGTPIEVVRPPTEPTAGLVVIPDIGGLRPLFDDHVARLSSENGWAVAAVEPFPGREHLTLEERLAERVGALSDRLLADAVAAADLLAAKPVGLIGFCMGGMYAMLGAETGRFARSVAFYGMIRVPDQWYVEGQRHPLDAVADPAACPVLAIIGTADPWTPPEDVAALEAAGVEVVRYDGAEHGFAHDPARPAHRGADAADAWRRALEFLRA